MSAILPSGSHARIFMQLVEELRTTLAHFHDPEYRPPALLCAVAGCQAGDAPNRLHAVILQAIQDMRPDPVAPSGARSVRAYEVLFHRYVLGLTQEDTAGRLFVSVRQLNRLQRKAVHALAAKLWASRPSDVPWPSEGPVDPDATLEAEDEDEPVGAWRSQAEKELASLQVDAAGSVCDVQEQIAHVLELAATMAAKHDITIEVAHVQPHLVAAIHPTVLSQMLVAAIWRLTRCVSSGPVTLFASLEDGDATITLTGTVAPDAKSLVPDLFRDILTPDGASVEAVMAGEKVFLHIRVPSSGRKTVLVVDDNADLIRFYRRCTAGAHYRIIHVAQGQGLFETIQRCAPDAIVLDVMLPDVDGWRLLMQLHEHPATRDIPVIVCTVVRDEDLALSLGAACYLSKPVRPREFLQALSQVLPRG